MVLRILKGLFAITVLIGAGSADASSKKELPIFNKLYSFFSNKEKDLEFKFDELVDL